MCIRDRYRNIGEEYRLPQITIGANEHWKPYLGDLSIIIWVRYYAHTQTQNTHAHTALNTKTNKIKRVKDVKVKKKTTKMQMNYGVKILHSF